LTQIPKILHQTWRTPFIPQKWQKYSQGAQNIYRDWKYILWDDTKMIRFVKEKFPDFYPVWLAFPKMIMKVDTFRYLLMYEIGGMYFDLDYEMLKPYDFSNKQVVLPKERSFSYGDNTDDIGNCIFASIPKHIFWKDVIDALMDKPPQVCSYIDVGGATGPAFLTKIYKADTKRYADIITPERINFHPLPPHNKKDYQLLINSDVYGIHHGWGSWKERLTLVYLKKKIQKVMKATVININP